MDGLGLALLGIFLVSFTVSKPVELYESLTGSSSESSESNETASSEEETLPQTTLQPIELNTLGTDILQQSNNTTPQAGLPQTTLNPSLVAQDVVEFDLNISFVPLDPIEPVSLGPDAERVSSPDVTTPQRCYTFPLTSPQPNPARGDNV